VVHYLNQFFGGIGGEEHANAPLHVQQGPVGPGRVLEQVLGNGGQVAATIVCGDNYFSEQREKALDSLVEGLKESRPDMVVAGPAFDAGRYGLACGAVCKAAQDMGIPAVGGMHPENPGALTFGREAIIVPTGASPAEMRQAMSAMSRLAVKLGSGEELGPAEAEGYLPRGIRRVGMRREPGYVRAVDMLVDKLNGRPFKTEVPVYLPDQVAPAPPVDDIRSATIALVTTGGLVRKGNPDRQVPANARRFYRHSVKELQSMSGRDWEAFHSGYFNGIVNQNPNYILPLCFMRDLEREGAIASVYPWIYALPGVSTPVMYARQLGSDIARELREDGVDGCILVAT
jgi:glycine reductase